MRRVLFVCLLLLPLAACASPYFGAKLGRMSGSVAVMWVGENNFVYLPGLHQEQTFKFETATTGRLIEPGLMYTDGGSIPRFAQAFTGFSPWGYGPAYIIHDWIFYGRHCLVDSGLPGQEAYNDAWRFRDVNGDLSLPHGHPRRHAVTFNESSLILAEVIKTLIDHGKVQPRSLPGEIISAAVDSPIAATLWDKEGECKGARVTPRHIARAWMRAVGHMNGEPPRTWRLSPREIADAKKYKEDAGNFLRQLSPDLDRPTQKRTAPVVAQAN